MSRLTLSQKNKILSGEALLPGSKSISNRVLIIRELCEKPFQIHQLSDADDTVVLQELLASDNPEWNTGPAGTTFRFLTALAAIQQKQVVVDGSARMRSRPVKVLVDALRTLGAEIEYVEKEGYPPLKINAGKLQGGELKLDSTVSSQYITALLLIAPKLEGGLTLHLEGETVSRPYIQMTAGIMQSFGAVVTVDDEKIEIQQGEYTPRSYTVEPDWSAAAFWYEWVALSEEGSSLFLPGLTFSGMQGDERAAEIFKAFGVNTTVEDEGIRIQKKTGAINFTGEIDLIEQPDLAPAVAVTMTGLELTGKITGLQTLSIKESDRIAVLQKELSKTGAEIEAGNDYLEIKGHSARPEGELFHFETYDDHRMAMAFAPLVQRFSKVSILDPEVVSKSYKTYWEQVSNHCYTED